MSDPSRDRAFALLQQQLGQSAAKEVPFGYGTSFPSSPLSGAVFFRSDLGWLCYFDGTRWLTMQEYTANFSQNQTTIVAGASYIIAPVRQDYAPYITRVTTQTIVLGTSNGTNYWTITLRGVSSNYGAASTIHTLTTAANTATTWSGADGLPATTQLPANHALLDLSVAITAGAPGGLVLSVTIYYRLIVT